MRQVDWMEGGVLSLSVEAEEQEGKDGAIEEACKEEGSCGSVASKEYSAEHGTDPVANGISNHNSGCGTTRVVWEHGTDHCSFYLCCHVNPDTLDGARS